MKNVLAFDIGGSFTKYAIIDKKGTILNESSLPTPTTYKDFLDMIKEIANKHRSAISGLSLAVPGSYDYANDNIFAPNLQVLNDQRIVCDIKAATGCSVLIENDANLAALGEYVYVEERIIMNMVFVTLGTGVGGGLVIDGKIPSSDFTTFEIGHMSLDVNGRLCGCGRRGCLDEYCSSGGLLQTYREQGGNIEITTPQAIAELAKSGDNIALATFEIYADTLSFALVNIANIFCPEKIKLGGGLAELSPYFLNRCKSSFDKSIFPLFKGRVEIEIAELKNKAGVLGAAAYYYGY